MRVDASHSCSVHQDEQVAHRRMRLASRVDRLRAADEGHRRVDERDVGDEQIEASSSASGSSMWNQFVSDTSLKGDNGGVPSVPAASDSRRRRRLWRGGQRKPLASMAGGGSEGSTRATATAQWCCRATANPALRGAHAL